MEYIHPDTLSFLNDLQHNNNREWFNENRTRYEKARDNFKLFVEQLIARLSSIDSSIGTPEAKDCIFRIYRDVRFSHNKSPYKTNMGAYVAKGSRKGMYAGYYFHIEPNASFLSGGIYHIPNSILKKVREDIDYYADDFISIVQDPQFVEVFQSLGDDSLKRVPTGFAPDSPVAEYLKLKSITPSHALSNEQLISKGLLDYAESIYQRMHPLISFINRAIDAE